MNTPVTINDSTDRLHLEVDRKLRVRSATIETFQDIPDEFLKDLQTQRDIQAGRFAADEVKVASLPGALVDHWYRNGFSVWDQNVTPQDIIDRLMREDLSKFITTTKSFA